MSSRSAWGRPWSATGSSGTRTTRAAGIDVPPQADPRQQPRKEPTEVGAPRQQRQEGKQERDRQSGRTLRDSPSNRNARNKAPGRIPHEPTPTSEPVFLAHYRVHRERFEWPQDYHWNSLGHRMCFEAVSQSRVLSRGVAN